MLSAEGPSAGHTSSCITKSPRMLIHRHIETDVPMDLDVQMTAICHKCGGRKRASAPGNPKTPTEFDEKPVSVPTNLLPSRDLRHIHPSPAGDLNHRLPGKTRDKTRYQYHPRDGKSFFGATARRHMAQAKHLFYLILTDSLSSNPGRPPEFCLVS